MSKDEEQKGSKESGLAGSGEVAVRKSSKESALRKSSKESRASQVASADVVAPKGSKESRASVVASGDVVAGAPGGKGSKESRASQLQSGEIAGSGVVGASASLASGGEDALVPVETSEEAGTAEDAQAIEDKAREEEDVFRAEPLHVRYLCRVEHRRTTNEISAEEEKLGKMKAEFEEPWILPSRKAELEVDIKRLEYQIRLRKQRIDRLVQLNPKTHSELPQELIGAARDGDIEFVRLAYEAKVDLNVQDKELLVTPLIMATIANKLTTVKLLLELKADQRIQDANGATCVHYAVQLEHVHALALMMDDQPGKDWDTLTIKDSRSMSAVDYARRPERSSCLRLLQNRMGGPMPVVWQVFKGWLSDKCGCCRPQVAKRKGMLDSCCMKK